jgi:hypothetical protein
MHLWILPLAVAVSLSAQKPAAFQRLDHDHWFVAPLHRGADGTWLASAPRYKVAVDQGLTFFPRLGAAHPRHLPLRWTTVSVESGGAPVTGGSAEDRVEAGGFRLVRRRGALREVYDLMAEGVEQSFNFEVPPATGGDLVLTGRIETPLRAAPLLAAHAELRFCDEQGQVRVSYGKALAFDAAGATTPVSTGWDGERLTLRVPGSWLATARFPVTVDPLIAPALVDGSADPVDFVDIAHDGASAAGNTMLVYGRTFTGGDHDVFARMTDRDFQNGSLVFSDVSPTLVSLSGHVAMVEGAGRWVVVWQQDDNAVPVSNIAVYLHDRGNRTLNSGPRLTVPRPPASTTRYPDVGGAATDGRKALIVYQSDITANQTNTINTETWGVVLDAPTATLATPLTLGHFTSGTTYDRELATVVNQSDGDGFSWVVAWHEFFSTVPTDDWDVNVARIAPNSTRTALFRFGVGGDPRHKRYPRVDGRGSRYIATFLVGGPASSPMGEELQVQRFDWLESQTTPSMQPPRTLVRDSARQDFAFPRIAFDDTTRSHWAISYQRGITAGNEARAARVGFHGGITELIPVGSSPGETVIDHEVVFDRGAGEFQIALAVGAPGQGLVRGARLLYPATAVSTVVGTGCGGAISSTAPYAGSEFFTVALDGALPGVASILLLSSPVSPIDLAPAGMPGCFLHTALPGFGLWPVLTSPQGRAAVTIPLDDTPLITGDVQFQWLHLAPGTNATGLLATPGLRSAIR